MLNKIKIINIYILLFISFVIFYDKNIFASTSYYVNNITKDFTGNLFNIIENDCCIIKEEVKNIQFDYNGHYQYCPSTLIENNKDYTYFCMNENKNIVRDSVYLIIDNGYPQKILSTSKNSWDSYHVCDPCVVKTNILYNEKNYKYVMVYLGCETSNCTNNQIGIALSNDLVSWIKILNEPLIKCNFDNAWGVGQPSIIDIGTGLAIFYTQGTIEETCEYVNVYNYDLTLQYTKRISNNGLNDFISNADFAVYENELYMICDKHPFANPIDYISSASYIYKTTYNIENIDECTWTFVDKVDIDNSNYANNHNAGFKRYDKGYLYNKSLLYTVANTSLWEYRIKDYSF